METPQRICTAFAGDRLVASGDVKTAAIAAKRASEQGGNVSILIFDDATGRVVDIDLRGSEDEIAARLAAGVTAMGDPAETRTRGPGRPRLGVVAREVTLLPRHWEWLSAQPGGASVALRKLVDQARHANEAADRVRQSREAAYRFMSAMAGDRPGYEDALRALYAGDPEVFSEKVAAWPRDIAEHAGRLAAPAFPSRATLI